MNLDQLRDKHSALRYEDFEIFKDRDQLRVRFDFLLEPDINFNPEISVEFPAKLDEKQLESYAFHLGLIEAISYWKCACPARFIVKAGALTTEQIAWWHDLFLHGLGEFFYLNQIDFSSANFLNIESTGERRFSVDTTSEAFGSLLLVAGGKDSAVMLELLRELEEPKTVLMLNPTPAAQDVADIAGYSDQLIVRRKIDAKLIELNSQGYLNGHTPFSAYLAFLGVFVAHLKNYARVIVANERSANEGNATLFGMTVNHQYSKSYRFECLFRNYVNQYLTKDIEYFSFLRPIYDLQVAELFSKFDKYFSSFRSCNVGQKTNSWCGSCPKCAFVYLCLGPFLSAEQLRTIFSAELLDNPEIRGHIRELVGLEEIKPFECVGTEQECRRAVALFAHAHPDLEFFSSLVRELPEVEFTDSYSNEHNIPESIESYLEDRL